MAPPPIARLTDIVEAIELIRSETAGATLQSLQSDKRKCWLVERGLEIISEATRHLSDELKPDTLKFRGQKWRRWAMCSVMNTSASLTTCYGGS